MDEVRERESEVIETFQSEGMLTEAAFLEQGDDGVYLVYFMEAEDLREVYESFSESTHDIDQEQKEVMDDVLESPKDLGVGNYELLYYMVNPDRAFQPITRLKNRISTEPNTSRWSQPEGASSF
nr:hypothetical protein [Halorubrum lacusprofundi]